MCLFTCGWVGGWVGGWMGQITGEYRPEYAKAKCAPMENITDSNYHAFNWKNNVVEEVMISSQYTHSFITIPFFNLTVPLYDLHASDGIGGDCTHYCQLSGRLVWAPVWSAILSVVQNYGNRTVGEGNIGNMTTVGMGGNLTMGELMN